MIALTPAWTAARKRASAAVLLVLASAAIARPHPAPFDRLALAAAITAVPQPLPTAGATATATPRVIVIAQPTATPRPSAPLPRTIAPPRPTSTPVPFPTRMPTRVPTPFPTPIPTTAAPTNAPSTGVRIDFSAADWVGGFYRGDSRAYGRPWVALYGAASGYPRATLTFSLATAPNQPATLTVAGLDDEWPVANEIALEVNGQRVFSGRSPFLNWDGVGNGADAAWTRAVFTIPADALRDGANRITVANLTPGANFNAPPYVLLGDAALEIPSHGSGPQPPQVPIAEFDAADWRGGYYQGNGRFYGRPWTAVYGAASAYPRATLVFRLDAPPTGRATFKMVGLDDELPAANSIAVEVNGERVFSGPSPFANWDGVGNGANAAWSQATITIPPELLRAGRNEVTVLNLSPSGNFNAPPYILLAGATLEMPGAT